MATERVPALLEKPGYLGKVNLESPFLTIRHGERMGIIPSIPLASVLHAEYMQQRNLEIAEGRHTPGELLPVNLDPLLLRQLFINLGRKDIHHEERNAYGQIVKDGTPIDWYNPTQPFEDGKDTVMAVRFEPRDSELSFVGFLKKNPQDGKYSFDLDRPIIDMAQDPSITFDQKGHPVLSVVSIQANEDGKINFKTVQYRGSYVRNLRFFQTIPGKDNRPVQLPDGRVRCFYRPQGEVGDSGKLAVRDYPNWEAFRDDANRRPLNKADFLGTNFQDNNHGGPNFPLPDGQVYGHIAEKEHDKNGMIRLHYYVTWMLTDPETGQILYEKDPTTGILKPLIKVVADRSDYPDSSELIPDKDLENPAKIHDVVFTGGVEYLENGRVRITNGISDTRIGTKEIDDPMLGVNLSLVKLVH